MYHSIEEFTVDWERESTATLGVLRAITDKALSRRVDPEGRTLGMVAWHLVLTLGEMGGRAGLTVDAPPEGAPVPDSSVEISASYSRAARSLSEQVARTWTDAMLGDELEMYGSRWTRAGVLQSLVRHQIHHRGQATVLVRQAGLAVPGVYGPAREEWARMGMPAQP
jgi:uncharacterized damage-inducible protein DinB